MAKCLCSGCNLQFSSVGSFDKHRVGSYGDAIYIGNKFSHYEKHSRRCLAVDEMKGKGMFLRENGLWGSEKWEDAGSVFPRFAKIS